MPRSLSLDSQPRGVISLQKCMSKWDMVNYMSQNSLHPARSGEEGFYSLTCSYVYKKGFSLQMPVLYWIEFKGVPVILSVGVYICISAKCFCCIIFYKLPCSLPGDSMKARLEKTQCDQCKVQITPSSIQHYYY